MNKFSPQVKKNKLVTLKYKKTPKDNKKDVGLLEKTATLTVPEKYWTQIEADIKHNTSFSQRAVL